LTFFRARLLLDDLRNAPTRKSLQRKLIQAPKGLFNLYARITKRLSEVLDEDQLLLCRRILQWIITTKEPLTVKQLAVALAVQDGEESLDEADMMFDPHEEILTVCAPLVEIVDDDIVRIVHLSVKDFLLDSARTDGLSEFTFFKDSLNADVGISLLTLLSFNAFSATFIKHGRDHRFQEENLPVDAPSPSCIPNKADDQSFDEPETPPAAVMLQ
jgi:hypothetical protein